jgi:hypothetical protein
MAWYLVDHMENFTFVLPIKYRGLRGPQSRSGHSDGEEKTLALAGNQGPVVQSVASNITELSCLMHNVYFVSSMCDITLT